MKFILTTDTSCDAFKTELDRLGVPWIPLTYTIDGVTYEDNFSSDDEYLDFYQKLEDGAKPTTSQINPAEHAAFFERVLDEHKGLPIVHLSLSGGLSGTAQSAKAGAAETTAKIPGAEIFVVDTLSACQGMRCVLDEGLRLRDAGTDAKTAAESLVRFSGRVHHWLAVTNLNHLKRGGRISFIGALLGTLLKIKPIIIFNHEGKLAVVKKAFGIQKAIRHFMDMIAEYKTEPDGAFYLVDAGESAATNELKKRIEEAYPGVPVKIGRVGPVIGAHTSSGLFGVAFVANERLTDK